jgi:tight adherence protein C
MDLLIILFLLAFSVGLIVYSVLPRQGQSRDVLKRRLEGRRSVDETAEIKSKARQIVTESLVRKATPILSKLVMPVSQDEQTQLRQKLAQAGFRHRQAQTVFLASKSAIAIVGLLAGMSTAMYMGWGTNWMVSAAILGAGVGFIAPGFWLDSAIAGRKTRIRRGLPDVLDLLVVTVEAGLALDASIKRVGEEMSSVHPEIAEELSIATRETQMGIRRSEALDNMANRVGIDEVRALVSVISQAERFGTSVSKALRSQADSIRTKRRQKAEEKAQQTAVKLMIPLVLFIFPALGVVLAGPAAISLFRNL